MHQPLPVSLAGQAPLEVLDHLSALSNLRPHPSLVVLESQFFLAALVYLVSQVYLVRLWSLRSRAVLAIQEASSSLGVRVPPVFLSVPQALAHPVCPLALANQEDPVSPLGQQPHALQANQPGQVHPCLPLGQPNRFFLAQLFAQANLASQPIPSHHLRLDLHVAQQVPLPQDARADQADLALLAGQESLVALAALAALAARLDQALRSALVVLAAQEGQECIWAAVSSNRSRHHH